MPLLFFFLIMILTPLAAYLYSTVGGHCKTLQDYSRLYHKGPIELSIFQSSFLILCLTTITIIGLSLLPNLFVLAKVEGDVWQIPY
jgi:hypothetical protein